MSEEINHDRRRFLGTAAMTIAAAELIHDRFRDAQCSKMNPADATTIKRRTTTLFGSLRQIDAGVLNLGYAHCRHIQLYGRHSS
jgi:hypothetical protein